MSGLYRHAYGDWLRLRARMKGERRYAVLREIQHEQWLDPEALARVQISRVRRLVDHALKNSSYYQERLAGVLDDSRDITSPGDLEKLPLLKRSDLQVDHQRILCHGERGLYEDASGGSTGNPVICYHDDAYKDFAGALEQMFMSWIDVSRGDKTGVFWGADRDFKDWSLKERLFFKLERVRLLNSFNVTEQALDAFLGELQVFKPTYIYGYASSLHLAAEYINRTGKFTIRPQAVKSSAEMLYESQRAEIEKAFGTGVYNFYGSREVNNLAAECPSHEGLHVMASGRIIEVVDELGRQVPDGETGYLAVTDLTNFSFPFIRYMIGDMGIMKKSSCSCGRGFPLLEGLTGRSSDILTINGKLIHGEYFTHLFYGRPEVRQFQVVQEKADYLIIKIVPADKAVDTQNIVDVVREKIGDNVTVEIKLVNDIPPLSSGKYRFTINNMKS